MRHALIILALSTALQATDALAMRLPPVKSVSLMQRPRLIEKLERRDSYMRCHLVLDLRPEWQGHNCRDRRDSTLLIQDYSHEIATLDREIKRGLDRACEAKFGAAFSGGSVVKSSSARTRRRTYSVLCSRSR